ncbi:hypothetical protein [Rubrimonas sp.]|uniref:hypothetical protein n=1 Tax=Rubrimonas sp. TaxID=2036015 RepID=UPI002FDDEC13
MKPLRLRLENFGSDPAGADSDSRRELDEAVARARGEGHASGYAEGFAAADATAEAENRRAVIALVESLRDLDLDWRAARAEAIAALGPVLAAVAGAVAPEAARRGLAEALERAVAERLASAPQARLVARCAPEHFDGLALRLGDQVELRADPALSGAQARLDWDGGGAAYDAEACARAALRAIDEFFAEAEEEMRHVG